MADYNVKTFDNDGKDHTNDFTNTDEGWFTPSFFTGLNSLYSFYLKHYNFDESAEIGATGTGLFNPFLNMNGGSTLLGFNTNDDIKKPYTDAGLTISDPNTDAIQLGDIPIVYKDFDGDGQLEGYYLINLDINENVNKDVSLEELQLFTSSDPATLADYQSGGGIAFSAADGFTLRFDLDANADNKLILEDDGAGQGKQDYTFYFPVSMFSGSSPTDYLTLFSQFGPEPPDDAGFAEWNVLNAAKIEGTKFLDVNGNGVRDEDGVDNILGNADDEVGLAGFTMYIDLNGNDKLDANEQTALTDADGHFTFYSLLPNTTYVVREVLTSADVNGPSDAGPDVNFATYAPPPGAWDLTTGTASGDHVVAITTADTYLLDVGNHLQLPDFSIQKQILSVVGGVELQGGDPNTTADNAVDGAGDQINYRILITNTGELALALTSISDALEGIGVTVTADSFTESGTNNNILDVGETWTWDWTETVTQAELDAVCADDETITNTVTATFNYNGTDIGPSGDTVNTTVVCSPDFTATKSIVSVDGGVELLGGDPLTTADDAVDSVGDQINYAITIVNTGNVTLDGETITDTFEGAASGLTAADFTETGGDAALNGNGILDVGETWTYNFSETVTQDMIDAACGDDEKLTNTLAASFVFDGVTLGPKGNSVDTPVDCTPTVELIKYVDVGFGWDDANTGPGPNNVNVGSDVSFKITVENTGNVTLTAVDITDTYHSGGASGPANLLVDDGVLTAYAIAHNAVLTGDDNDGDAGNGLVADGILQAGETWTITYTEAFDPLSASPGSHLNTADVNTAEGATDEDSAYYFSLVDTGLCPRTPGFWQNMKNGGQFWDGIANNEKHAGADGFPDGELMYAVDSDGNGSINVGVKGLLIGDYNKNGLTDSDEDTLFVSYSDALKLINASNKQLNGLSGDGKYMLGRDMVASWLNYLQGSGFGDPSDLNNPADTHSPAHYLNDAIDWMQKFSGTDSDTSSTDQFDIFKLSTGTIKTSSAIWNSPQSPIDHSASQMHSALDYYNNTGQTEVGGTHYANCCTDEFITALGIYETAHG